MSTWKDDHAYTRVAAWERAQVAQLATRLRREWRTEAAVPWTDVAIVINALVEGAHLGHVPPVGTPGGPLPVELVDELVATVARIVEFFLTEVQGSDQPIRDELPSDHGPGPQAGLLPPWMVAALHDGSLAALMEEPRRVLDMGVLARSVGVSERSLYARWPSAADLNTELFLESSERMRRAYVQKILDVFQASVTATSTDALALIARLCEWFMDPDRFGEATVHLGLVDTLARRGCLERVRSSIEIGAQHADLATAGISWATGFRLRSDLRARSYTLLTVANGLGSHRTLALHPEIGRRRLRYEGNWHTTCGLGHTAFFRSSCEPVQSADLGPHIASGGTTELDSHPPRWSALDRQAPILPARWPGTGT